MLNIFPIDLNIHKTSDYKECFEFYKKNEYKNIFINYDEKGKKLAQSITQDNPKQKIILMNNNFISEKKYTCEICKKQFNKISLIKPLNQEQISKAICNKLFCEVKDKNELTFILEQINKKIKKEFPYFKYSFNNDYSLLSSEIMNARILVFITDLLKKDHIDFEVLDYDKIKIIKNCCLL